MKPSRETVTTLGLAHRHYGDFAFGLRQTDRLMHCYIIGQTGTGKSTLLGNMALQDAAQGNGFCLVDPHGDLAERLSETLGDRAISWTVADPDSPYGYNPLTRVSPPLRPLIASGLVETLKRQWEDAWGVRMEHLLRHAVLALLDTPRTDLRDILRLFLERDFRMDVLEYVSDPQLRQFWMQEYPKMNYKNAADGLAPIANKLGAFLSHPVVRRAVCEPNEPLRFRRLMDERGILIVNLAKGRLGTDIANVLGGLIVSGIAHAAFTRHDIPEGARQPFFLYVDEFHAFTTETVANLLSETRKYRLGVVLGQQHTQQSSPAVFASVMGNAGTLIAFRIGAADAPVISAQLGGVEPRDLVNLPNYRAFVRMMIDGQPAPAFTMTARPGSFGSGEGRDWLRRADRIHWSNDT
ncbi:type IV secretory system conjugative DNA transfer family protein [Roseovarius nitratireducens]|uniref:type IV secretory system conjugative DNA transfer family protein n=1 Tax=Roseovarius nitratireducens TaxID=2044597 RepID=UPI000CE22E5D|nr:type IV secretion system DNA-binding domain-containing protein [Roseovarius nitratireducens]